MLTAVCAVLCLGAIAGVVATALLLAALPPAPDLSWASPWARVSSSPPPQSERKTRLEHASVLAQSLALRALASPHSTGELDKAASAFENRGIGQGAAPSHVEQELAVAVSRVQESARGSAVIAIAAFAIMGLSGFLGLLRLRVRGVTILSCSLLVLGASGATAALALGMDVGPACALIPAMLSLLGFFGQLVGTNLLPDSNHPFVVDAETRLRSLPRERRRRFLAWRLLAGLFLSAVAVAGTIGSYLLASPGGIYWVYTGSLAFGLIVAATPFIAAVRVAAGRHPAAP